jgi:SH3-like domain-containing protein
MPLALVLSRLDRWRRPALLAALAVMPVWLISTVLFGSKIYQVEMIRHGIVLAERVDVRTGPDADETKRFELHEGDRAQIVHRSGDWYRIALDSGENGWIEARSIEPIHAP